MQKLESKLPLRRKFLVANAVESSQGKNNSPPGYANDSGKMTITSLFPILACPPRHARGVEDSPAVGRDSAWVQVIFDADLPELAMLQPILKWHARHSGWIHGIGFNVHQNRVPQNFLIDVYTALKKAQERLSREDPASDLRLVVDRAITYFRCNEDWTIRLDEKTHQIIKHNEEQDDLIFRSREVS